MELVNPLHNSLLFFMDLVSSLSAPSNTPSALSNQEKVLTQDQLAEMPSCNLAESVHNKWLQASGNKGGDLYVATVDDYIRVFLQVVAYYTFLKGGVAGDGPSKEELKLRGAQRRAQRTGDPTMLQNVLLNMPGRAEFCTRDPHLVGLIMRARIRSALQGLSPIIRASLRLLTPVCDIITNSNRSSVRTSSSASTT